MRLIVEIECDNAAFSPDAGPECARLLRQVADRICTDSDISEAYGALVDHNGNRCGQFEGGE